MSKASSRAVKPSRACSTSKSSCLGQAGIRADICKGHKTGRVILLTPPCLAGPMPIFAAHLPHESLRRLYRNATHLVCWQHAPKSKKTPHASRRSLTSRVVVFGSETLGPPLPCASWHKGARPQARTNQEWPWVSANVSKAGRLGGYKNHLHGEDTED